MTTMLNNIVFKARTHPKHRFQNLYGLLNTDSLYQSWGQRLPENINRLIRDLKQKCYRANDIKRICIPKSNGKQRPLGLPTVDDKLVQQSVSQMLQEQDFLHNSYGYRPNKSAHQAIHSLGLNL